jgi:hypothetical protein
VKRSFKERSSQQGATVIEYIIAFQSSHLKIVCFCLPKQHQHIFEFKGAHHIE